MAESASPDTHGGERGGIRLTREHQMSLDLIQESLEPEGPDAALVWRLDAEDRRTLYEAFLALRHVAAHGGEREVLKGVDALIQYIRQIRERPKRSLLELRQDYWAAYPDRAYLIEMIEPILAWSQLHLRSWHCAIQRFDAIIVRCTEGDPRTNWLTTIERLAREGRAALAQEGK